MTRPNREPPERPVFVCGVARSGTSLMRAILGCHSQIAMAPLELHWWTVLHRRHRRARRGPAWESFLEEFGTWPGTRSLGFEPAEIRSLVDRLPPGDHGAVFGAVMRAYAQRLGKPRWGEKTPQLELCLGEVLDAFPGARFVYMLRDPRDVAVSMYHFRPRSGARRRVVRDVAWVSLNWRGSVRVALRELTAHPERFVVVRYESLVERPAETVDGLCRWLGIASEPAMLEPDRFPGSHRAAGDRSVEGAAGIDARAVGRYRDGLAPRKVRISEWLLRGELEAAGYLPARPPLGKREAALLPIELAGAAADAAVRATDRLVRGLPR